MYSISFAIRNYDTSRRRYQYKNKPKRFRVKIMVKNSNWYKSVRVLCEKQFMSINCNDFSLVVSSP